MQKVKLVLIASGTGTDAAAIMAAHRKGFIPNVDIVGLVSTKASAGCLEKAEKYEIPSYIVDFRFHQPQAKFNQAMIQVVKNIFNAELVFLAGCIHRIPMIEGVKIYNIHPADPLKHGGEHMYGLNVHRHVLDEASDHIYRGWKKTTDSFFTYPTIHEALERYDDGEQLMQVAVEIPPDIISAYAKGFDQAGQIKKLQQKVLKYEWMMLPTAVKIAAEKILDEKGGYIDML